LSDVSEVLTASIVRAMIQILRDFTAQIPEDCHLEGLKIVAEIEEKRKREKEEDKEGIKKEIKSTVTSYTVQ
jgi:hypothetical protein